ncbi:MAG: hypothetical protein FD161_4913 [Limisphaerales bacterium]|nr:MAG: hypothetical protein FD161_4913 [Limisphaerales bacterium]
MSKPRYQLVKLARDENDPTREIETRRLQGPGPFRDLRRHAALIPLQVGFDWPMASRPINTQMAGETPVPKRTRWDHSAGDNGGNGSACNSRSHNPDGRAGPSERAGTSSDVSVSNSAGRITVKQEPGTTTITSTAAPLPRPTTPDRDTGDGGRAPASPGRSSESVPLTLGSRLSRHALGGRIQVTVTVDGREAVVFWTQDGCGDLGGWILGNEDLPFPNQLHALGQRRFRVNVTGAPLLQVSAYVRLCVMNEREVASATHTQQALDSWLPRQCTRAVDTARRLLPWLPHVPWLLRDLQGVLLERETRRVEQRGTTNDDGVRALRAFQAEHPFPATTYRGADTMGYGNCIPLGATHAPMDPADVAADDGPTNARPPQHLGRGERVLPGMGDVHVTVFADGVRAVVFWRLDTTADLGGWMSGNEPLPFTATRRQRGDRMYELHVEGIEWASVRTYMLACSVSAECASHHYLIQSALDTWLPPDAWGAIAQARQLEVWLGHKTRFQRDLLETMHHRLDQRRQVIHGDPHDSEFRALIVYVDHRDRMVEGTGNSADESGSEQDEPRAPPRRPDPPRSPKRRRFTFFLNKHWVIAVQAHPKALDPDKWAQGRGTWPFPAKVQRLDAQNTSVFVTDTPASAVRIYAKICTQDVATTMGDGGCTTSCTRDFRAKDAPRRSQRTWCWSGLSASYG